MKSKLFFAASALCAVLFTGCLVPSLEPLFEEKDLVAYSDLIGTWTQDGKGEDSWQFEKDGKYYKLTHVDSKKRTATFVGSVGKLGTNVFLDLFPGDSKLEGQVNDLQLVHLAPVHTFVKLSKQGSALHLTAMDIEWLNEALKQNPKLISHVSRKEYAILTASTPELQKFVTTYGDNTNVFKNVIKLESKK
ncbi:MAG TPA: hypothetical protein VK530_06895 [Candidatus Acidoferrum sp.]|nr:hypothetical protein [Candidatus Acidoferrum sp.]